MSFFTVVGGALALGTTVYKGIKGQQQINQAKNMALNDPGYQLNQGIIDNARQLSEKYNNYVMPGYSQALQRINQNYATGMNAAEQGATSGGDILDAANKLNYNQNQATNQLAVTGANMKENLLPTVLQANSAAGNEYVKKGEYDSGRYDQQVAAKAALTQAGNENLYGALDSEAKFGGSLLSYNSPSSSALSSTGSGVKINPSLFSSYNKILKGGGNLGAFTSDFSTSADKTNNDLSIQLKKLIPGYNDYSALTPTV